jgi:hypothetical protein
MLRVRHSFLGLGIYYAYLITDYIAVTMNKSKPIRESLAGYFDFKFEITVIDG